MRPSFVSPQKRKSFDSKGKSFAALAIQQEISSRVRGCPTPPAGVGKELLCILEEEFEGTPGGVRRAAAGSGGGFGKAGELKHLHADVQVACPASRRRGVAASRCGGVAACMQAVRRVGVVRRRAAACGGVRASRVLRGRAVLP